MFEVNDIIRNKDPYLGEGTKIVVKKEDLFYWVVQNHSRYGKCDDFKYKEMIWFEEIENNYRKATKLERFYLFIWAMITEIKR